MLFSTRITQTGYYSDLFSTNCHLALVKLLHLVQVVLQSFPLVFQLSNSLLQLHEQTDVHCSLLYSHLLHR